MANTIDIPAPAVNTDLRALLKRTGPPTSPTYWLPAERHMWDGPVVDVKPGTIELEPGQHPTTFVDGVQASVVLGLSNPSVSRPTLLCVASAGAACWPGFTRSLATIAERIWLYASYLDTEEVSHLPGGVPVVWGDEHLTPSVRPNGLRHLNDVRAELERSVIASHIEAGDPLIVVDGSLLGFEAADSLVGISKTLRTRYLADEEPLVHIPAGSATRPFIISARERTESDRLSAYLRLHPPRVGAFEHGLVRVESFSEEALWQACEVALAHRQSHLSGDPRWDRQISAMAAVELILHARLPAPLR